MSRRTLAALAAVMLALPVAAHAEDDCKKDSAPKYPAAEYTVRYEIKLKNKSKETLLADFYATHTDLKTKVTGASKKVTSKALSPGQGVTVIDNVPKGTEVKVETKLKSYDGTMTFDPTSFSVKNVSGGGRIYFYAGPFDSKITCDRRYGSDSHRWFVNYVVNSK
ncbi:MAG: hypothetical protein GC201_09730 [Alphaproteobacteria bacterium]|nr:hypothetical protein [Alphaproteobacteria bacterium]